MAFISADEQILRERDAGLARRQALQNQIGQGLQGFANIDRQNKAAERQALLDQQRLEQQQLENAARFGVNPLEAQAGQENQQFRQGQGLVTPEGQELAGPTPQAQPQTRATMLGDVAAQTQERRAQTQKSQGLANTLRQHQVEQAALPVGESKAFQEKQIIAQTTANRQAQKAARKQERKIKEQQRKSQIPGFKQLDTNIIATPQDKEVVKKLNTATLNIGDAGKKLLESVSKHGITSGTGVTKGDRDVTQKKRDLQLQLKELFNLGVLNGPDLALLDDALGAIQGPIDMLNPYNTKESAKSQIEHVLRSAQAKMDNAAQARGFRADKPIIEPSGTAEEDSIFQNIGVPTANASEFGGEEIQRVMQIPREQRQSRIQQLRQKAGK